MKRTLYFLGLVIAIGFTAYGLMASAAGCTPFLVASGGTGGCTWTSSQLLYGAGTGALKSVATSSVSAGSGVIISGTGSVVGGSLTISASGANTISTTSPISIGNLAYFTGISPTSIGGVATSTLSAGTGLTGSFTQVGSGGSLALSIPVSIANGGTNATSFGTSNGITAYDGTRLVNFAGYTLTGSVLTATNASTTRLTASSYAEIPASANPSVTASGQVAIDTTAASSSLHYSDGSTEHALFDVQSVGFSYGTSTPAGTTTIQIAGPIRKVTYTSIGCSSIGGTANVQLGNGTASTTVVISATGNVTTATTLSNNNSFSQGQVGYIALGTWSSTGISNLSCSFGRQYDPN